MGALHGAARTCLLLVTSVVVSLLVAAPAHAAPVALSGTVTAVGGAPLRGVEVTVYASGSAVDDVTTDSTGAWSVQVEPGTYTLGFDDPEGWYKPEYWDDKTSLSTATPVSVTTSGRSGLAMQLARWPVFSGTVRSGGEPVAGAEVRAYSSTAETDSVRTETTAADGTYRVPLKPGTYRFAFESPAHVTEYWDDRATLAASTPVTIGSSDVTGRDVSLTALPTVGGRVTAGGSGVRRPEVTVYARDLAGEYWVEQTTVTGDAQGRWSTRLEPGRYAFRFAGDARHRTEFWSDRLALSTATPVDVAAGATTLDADLAILPTVRGRAVDASGEGVEDAEVTLLDDAGDEVASSATGPDGGFAVPASPGAYGLRIAADGFRTWTRAVDDPALLGPQGTSVGTVSLVAASAIRGRVTGPGGAGVRTTVVVHASTIVGGRTWWSEWDRVRTAADGTYAAPVPPGDYRLEVEATEELQGAFWDGATTLDTARTVTVGDADVTGRDVRLAALSRAGVQGTVTTSGGAPLPGAQVDVYESRPEGWSVVQQATTGRDGTYRVTLPAGTYRLGYSADVHRPTFGPGATTVETAPSVSVGASLVTRDVRLVPVTARIQGTVRGPSAPLRGVEVTVLSGTSDDLAPVTSARTDADGRYEVKVDAGRYVLAFEDPSGNHRGEYFDDVTTWASAARVTVEDGATLTGRDVRLDAHPHLVGQVVTAAGAPVSGATVRLTRSFTDGGDVVAEDETAADGRYDLPAPAGTYAAEVLVDGDTRWSLNTLTLGAGTTTRTITLADLRTVTGRLTGPDGRAAVGVEVRAWRYDPAEDAGDGDGVVVARATTGTDGRYAIPVPPGVYRIGFHGLAAGYATEYADDAKDLRSARAVRVAAADVTGVDAVLAPATGLSGTISDVAALSDGAWPELEAVYYRWDDSSGRWVEEARTTPGYGPYVVELPPGRYRVRVIERQEPFRTTYFGGGSTFSSGGEVEVRAGAVSPGVDVSIGSSLGTVLGVVAPVVGGTATVGGTLTVGLDVWLPGDVTTSVQWLRDGQPIAGATQRSYVVGPADDGRQVAARVVASRAGYQSAQATSAARTISPGTLLASTLPEIQAEPVVGSLVAATAPVWSVLGVTTTWQWLRDGVPIAGATSSTYTPTAADAGRALSVRATGTLLGYLPLTLTSAARTVTEPLLTAVAPPSLSGTAVVGSTVSGTDGSWSRTPATLTRQWLRDGVAVPGATQSTYRLTADDVGHDVALRVTAALATGAPVERTSSPIRVAAGTIVAQTAPRVEGTARPGMVLTARPGSWSATYPAAGTTTFAYQWLRGTAPISGATSSTYRPTTSDLGKVLTVAVTATLPGHTDARRTATSATVKALPTVSVSATGGRRTATFTVVVKATGATPSGQVRVRLGSRVLKTVSLTTYRGTRRAVLVVKGQAKGTRTYTIEYRGDAKVSARTVTKKVTVR
jgi:5-hydroxyisourate hydrolase-like protein (transthyretin family)